MHITATVDPSGGEVLGRRPWRLRRWQDGSVTTELLWRDRSALLVLPLLLLLQAFFPHRIWLVLLLIFAASLAGSAAWAWQLARHLSAGRRLRFGWVQVGDVLEEQFSLVNAGWAPAFWVEIVDFSNLPGYNAGSVRAVGPYGTYRWSSSGVSRLRGEYHLGPWEWRSSDPLGLFAVRQHLADQRTVLVYPPVAQRLPFPLPPGASTGDTRISRRAWEQTVNAAGVRAYVPGDPFHRVHWPTTARRGALHVKEFDQETGSNVWLLPDLYAPVQVGRDGEIGEDSTLERSVVLAASLAAHLLDAGRGVGLFAYAPAQQALAPATGKGQLWRILRALATARAGDVALDRALQDAARVVPHGSTLLLLTPDLRASWLDALAGVTGRGLGVTAVLLDAGAWGGRGDAEALRALLAARGIWAQAVPVDAPLALLPRLGPAQRWGFKVLGTGRVIAVARPRGA